MRFPQRCFLVCRFQAAFIGLVRQGCLFAKTSVLVQLILVAFVLLLRPVQAQAPPLKPTDSEWYFRYELFQVLLEKRGLQVSKFVNDAVMLPNESVIVVLGDLQKISPATWSNLRSFLSQGGNLLVATDRTPRVLGIGILDIGSVNIGPVLSPGTEDRYEGFSDCLRIHNLDQQHPITAGLSEIVTNRSGWLSKPLSTRGDVPRWQPIATLPEDCQPIGSQSKALIAVYQKTNPKSGSALLIADASLFTNSMLWHADNGLLSIRVADWLCRTDRKRLVYLVDGLALPSYAESAIQNRLSELGDNSNTTKSSQRKMPDAQTLLQFANLAIKRVAESNILNESLKNQPRNLDSKTYFRWVWGLFAIFAMSLIAVLLIRRTALIAPFLPSRRMRSWHDIQTKAQHTLDQNTFAAECLARDFCRQWTGKDSASEWQLYLQDIDLDVGPIPISNQERSSVRTLVELAIYGRKSLFTDEQLQNLGIKIRALLLKLSAVR
jgi:hypothetical protein